MSSILKNSGETELIKRLTATLKLSDSVITGPGDDCAVVRLPGSQHDLVLTSDPVTEGIHFCRNIDPAMAGRKAAGRVLSDIAAMGAKPLWLLANIAAPADCDSKTLEQLFKGFKELTEICGACVAGGDVSEAPTIQVNAFGAGSLPAGSAVLRSGSKPDDIIFTTGKLGGSRSGHHLDFTPRTREGAWLRGRATSMIDISDGLSSDLHRICEASGTGALLHKSSIPVSDAGAAMDDGRSPLEHALNDGEDFELLFTIPCLDEEIFLNDWNSVFEQSCYRIGSMTDTGEILIKDNDGKMTLLKPAGYEHFKQ